MAQPASQSTASYDVLTSAWKDHRCRRLWCFGTWLAGAAFFGVSFCLGNGFIQDWGIGWAIEIVVFIWFLCFQIFAIRLALFKCPRCGRFFHFSWLYHNIFALHCVNCRLYLKALNDSPKRDP